VESDHDLLIELRRDVKHILRVLEGNGREGVCDQVDRHENVLTRHDVYFALMGATLAVVAACVLERFLL
jgi:hypothetical protein